MPTCRVWIDIGADKTKLIDATLELLDDALARSDASGLWQLADADEVLWVEFAHAVDQLIVVARPDHIGVFITHMVVHCDRLGRENRHVDAALFHDAQLIVIDAMTDFLVGHRRRWRGRCLTGPLKFSDLVCTKFGDLRWGRGEVAVAIDNHV